MGTRKVERGEVAEAVARNVRELRERRRWSQRKLAERLAAEGRPMQATGVSKIEAGDRRVDVDDLAALARVFETPPSRLMDGETMFSGTLTADQVQAFADRYDDVIGPVNTAVRRARDSGLSLGEIVAYLEWNAHAGDNLRVLVERWVADHGPGPWKVSDLLTEGGEA
jgi:transcriptional regulator with XRE-family HTH domain